MTMSKDSVNCMGVSILQGCVGRTLLSDTFDFDLLVSPLRPAFVPVLENPVIPNPAQGREKDLTMRM